MARTYTPLLAPAYHTASNANDYNAGNITWLTGDRVFVEVSSEIDNTDAASIQALTGLTFTQVGTRVRNSNGWGSTLDVFTGVATIGGTAQALHVLFAGGGGGGISVQCYKVTPSDVLGTPVNSTDGSNITIAALQDSASDALGFWGANTGTGALPTAGAGFTTIQTDSAAGTNPGSLTEYRTNVTTVSSDGGTHNVGLGVELKSSSPQVAVSGTVVSAPPTAANIVSGGKTIVLTISNDTWLTATAGAFDAIRQNIIDGIDSAQSETHGWDAEVKAKIAVTDVVRTSSTVVTITLDAEASYAITATETITVTVPSAATTLGLGAIVASPTFLVTPHAVPTFTSLTPNYDHPDGGQSVTITGTNFYTGATVTFGGSSATSVVVASTTSITCVTPAHATGLVDVVVTTDSGVATLASGFAYGICYIASAGTPADNSANAGTTATITPPAGLQANDLVIVAVQYRGTVTLTNSTTGGQTWTALTANTGTTNVNARLFYCIFNGTWSANPVFTNTAGTNAISAIMHGFRGVDTTTPVDVALTNGNVASATTITITGISTVTDHAAVFAAWFDAAARTFSGTTAGWTVVGGAQYRNTTGSAQANAYAYQTFASHGASGNVAKTQSTASACATMILALKPAAAVSPPTGQPTIRRFGGMGYGNPRPSGKQGLSVF